jgi:type IV pilus assembly protein PilY1
MKFMPQIAALALCAATGLYSVSHAEDTDLFMTTPPDTTELPNVLLILDNTANWSGSAEGTTKFALERAALAEVVANLPEDQYNIGLMLFSETGSGNANPSGGYVRSAIRQMTATNKADLIDLINNLEINEDKGNGAEYALAMHEAYLYFEGLNARSGHNKIKHDPAAFSALPRYESPVVDACVKNYIIFISNGAPDNGENTTAESLLSGLGGKLDNDPIRLTPSGRQANWSDEYARFMSAKGINTYTIDMYPSGGQADDNSALLTSMATHGNGQYFLVDSPGELVVSLESAFSEILAVNSVFAATSLPVSVNVRGTYLNEVYMAVFRPDANKSPRWFGNLKLYHFVKNPSTGELFLADANDQPAQNAGTGFIRNSAVSHWTEPSSYWDFGSYESPSDSPDGEVVEKGGSAQQQRQTWSLNGRNLYTCTSGCNSDSLLSATPFTDANTSITEGALGAANPSERTTLINWVRGADNTTPPERATGLVRPSLHGDVVHSRPAVINYNRAGNDTDIVVFYGANDGVFRAVRGGKSHPNGGSELWGFVAPEHFSKLQRLRNNSPLIHVPADPTDPDGNKPYFMDGIVSSYTYDHNSDGRIIAGDGDKAYLYVTMRRGGRFIYAFDVTVPETPRLLWKRSNSDTGYGELGQTWSEAKFARVNLGGTATPVLIMGAGYDAAAEDSTGSATMGRGVFVLNAETGNIIWQVGPDDGIQHSIAADVTVIDRNGDGYMDRVYAVDTGANVWRLDIGNTSTNNWSVSHLASLGGTGADARKFLYPADVVYGKDANGLYDAVLLGSGDRERPFDDTVDNHFYMLKDRRATTSAVGQTTIVLSELYDATDNLIQVGTQSQKDEEAAKLLAARGWYIRLDAGEKSVGSAVTVGGSVFFATNLPPVREPLSCTSVLGDARMYVLDYRNAIATLELDGEAGLTTDDRFTTVPGGGFLPSPTPVIVKLGDQCTGPDCEDDEGGGNGGNNGNGDGSGSSIDQTVCFGPNCITPPNVALETRRRVFWYKDID